MTTPYAIHMAARASKLPVEFFRGLPAQESMKLKNLVSGFLYGEGWRGVNPPEIKKSCIALSLQLHSGVDWLLGLPLDELNDMAKVVLEIAKKQGHGIGHKNRGKS